MSRRVHIPGAAHGSDFSPERFGNLDRKLLALAGKCELIAIGILEDGDRSPGLSLRLLRKRHAFGFEYFGSGEHIVAPERDGLEFANALLVALRREQGNAGLRPGNEEFNP